MGTLENIGSGDFDEKVLKAKGLVLVDFWAEWCNPCKALGGILDEVANEMGEKARILKVNVDQNNELAQQYGIRGIPTMIFFKNGSVSKTLVGMQSKEEIKKSLEELV